MVRVCSAGIRDRGRKTVTASKRILPISCDCKCDDVRNNCEMTHFFFSLNREPLQEQKLMPLVFYFDTHIITQVNLNVKYTFFDKVRNQMSLSHNIILTFAKVSAIGGTFGLFCGLSLVSLLELPYYLVVFLWRVTTSKKEIPENNSWAK